MLPMQGMWVPSLVREMKSCMLHSAAKNKKKINDSGFSLSVPMNNFSILVMLTDYFDYCSIIGILNWIV